MPPTNFMSREAISDDRKSSQHSGGMAAMHNSSLSAAARHGGLDGRCMIQPGGTMPSGATRHEMGEAEGEL
ncbi:hypothetical protein [Stieleria varia]|uniref:hypothetical protein n=1 Tax=Stieleria varia TaxID=2528005 RepID=UPI0011B8561C|nr:hypothetical protein [Stieleria varia]